MNELINFKWPNIELVSQMAPRYLNPSYKHLSYLS